MTPGSSRTFSIALATYNGARFLQQQLDSLAQQSLAPLELLVGDDGSTDDTMAILSSFARTAPFPVVLVQNPHRLGYRANFMAIAQRCRGDLIGFCDQDDVWSPRKLELMAASFDNPEVMLAFHNAALIDGDNRYRGLVCPQSRPSHVYAPLTADPWRPVHGHSQILRRVLLDWAPLQPQTIDPLDQGKPMAHDQFFFFWASILGIIAYQSAALVGYRQHDGNIHGMRETSRIAQAWRNIRQAPRYFPSEAAATGQRIAMLQNLPVQLSPGDRDRVEAAIAYHAEILPHIARRAQLYTDPSFGKRLAVFLELVRGGAYGNAKPWCFGAGGLAQDGFLGVPFGPFLKRAIADRETA